MNLASFPREIIDLILTSGDLELKDYRQLRLVCRRIGEIANSYALAQLKFNVSEEDLDLLNNVANSPVYVRHLTSLALHVVPIKKYGPADEQVTTRHADILAGRNTISLDRFHDGIKSFVAKIPKLGHLKVCAFIRRNPSAEPVPISEDEALFYAPYAYFLVQAAYKSGAALQSLELDGIHPSAFDTGGYGLYDLGDWFPHLTKLSLKIIDNDNNFTEGHVSDCAITMNRGVIRGALAKMRQLNKLDLSFVLPDLPTRESSLDGENAWERHIDLEDVIPLDVTWPNLENLLLARIKAPRQQLQALILKHHTLKVVRLELVDLDKISWKQFLPELRRGMDWSKRRLVLRGISYGRREDEARMDENLVLDYEYNDFGWDKTDVLAGRFRLGDAIEKWMREKDGTLPLDNPRWWQFA
ncbi:hypothetical protein QBC47DRAFT_440654 [Echria macrotheca]|uniref:F-box domain-containing protein n=1 Tax=Echria macrotheca TaxID=438768 RepID=A0AAJ0F8N0_9PEZI|nr:hypothetical protein QBC47DRAFT_440654 [Echria macrotheca]